METCSRKKTKRPSPKAATSPLDNFIQFFSVLSLGEGEITPVFWEGGNLSVKLNIVFDTVIGCGKILWGIILVVFLICVIVHNSVNSSSVLLFSKVDIAPVLRKGSLVSTKLN